MKRSHVLFGWRCVMVAMAVATAEAATAEPFRYHGFAFDVAAIHGRADEQALLDAAAGQVDIVEGVGFTADTLRFLRGYVVHLSEGTGGGRFGRDGVFVNLPPRVDDRPILLHELMHAYQAGRLEGGGRNPALQAFFQRARTGGMWPAGSYMLSNVNEFFAMTTSVALYGHAARPPFTRAALEEKQPRYAAWIRATIR